MRNRILAAVAAAFTVAAGGMVLGSTTASAENGCSMYQDFYGQWHAGFSDTNVIVVRRGNSGPVVKEVQCLIRYHHGIMPATLSIDGNFGGMTFIAVESLQEHCHIAIDGAVGPQTWGKLRGPVC